MMFSRLIGILLAGGCLVLMAMAGLLVAGPATDLLPQDNSREVVARDNWSSAEPGFAMAGHEAYAAIGERPLFSDSRRPLPPSPPPPPLPPKSEELGVTLRGTIIAPSLRLALLADDRTQQTIRLKQGRPLPGQQAEWRLSEVQPGQVTFLGTDETTRSITLPGEQP